MGNVVGIAGNIPVERTIADMSAGQVAYTVPWAYDQKQRELNEDFTICEKGGTASLRVECIRPGSYSLTFENASYRPISIKSKGDWLFDERSE